MADPADVIDLDTVKNHCRVEPDFSLDDPLFQIYIGAAKRYVEAWTRRTLYLLNTDQGYETDENRLLLDDDVRAAMLLLIGTWYANRESVVVGQSAITLPLAVESLLQPYRIYGI
ncbi:TPA: phage gp6-like head-tail connector protein [Serratia liquefaciens]|nr:phage gp6-like head-tail connector protein [Serratia liquefaciens]